MVHTSRSWGETDRRFSRYFPLLDLTTALFVVYVVLKAAHAPEIATIVSGAAWMLLLISLIPARMRDEFAEQCWRRATTAAFATLIAVPLAIGLVSGLVDGFADTDITGRFDDTVGTLIALIPFTAFFGAFHWHRLRGAAE